MGEHIGKDKHYCLLTEFDYDIFNVLVERVITNIIKEDRERAVGTYLGKDSEAYTNVINGQIFVGQANILGEDYYTGYKPIKDENEVIINTNKSAEKIYQASQMIKSIADQTNLLALNAAGTEEASASVEEQTASMEQIANASEGLAKLAEEMNGSINKFKY